MSGPDFELPAVELPFTVAGMDPTVPDADEVARDGGVLIMPAAGADAQPTYVPQSVLDADAKFASALLNLTPIIGNIKTSIEAFTGDDLITGEHLPWWERGLNLAYAVPVPEVEEVEVTALGHAILEIHEVGEKAHEAMHLYHAGEAFHELNERADEARELNEPGELEPPDLSPGEH